MHQTESIQNNHISQQVQKVASSLQELLLCYQVSLHRKQYDIYKYEKNDLRLKGPLD